VRRQEQLEKELEDEHMRTKSSIQVTDGTVFKLRDVEREMEQLRHELADREETCVMCTLGIMARWPCLSASTLT
jgi:hypothetical protein